MMVRLPFTWPDRVELTWSSRPSKTQLAARNHLLSSVFEWIRRFSCQWLPVHETLVEKYVQNKSDQEILYWPLSKISEIPTLTTLVCWMPRHTWLGVSHPIFSSPPLLLITPCHSMHCSLRCFHCWSLGTQMVHKVNSLTKLKFESHWCTFA